MPRGTVENKRKKGANSAEFYCEIDGFRVRLLCREVSLPDAAFVRREGMVSAQAMWDMEGICSQSRMLTLCRKTME